MRLKQSLVDLKRMDGIIIFYFVEKVKNSLQQISLLNAFLGAQNYLQSTIISLESLNQFSLLQQHYFWIQNQPAQNTKVFITSLAANQKATTNLYTNLLKDQMFLQSQKDIDNQRVQNQGNVPLRCFKPKLISSLNYEQQYLIRRKQKRNNRRKRQDQKSIAYETEAVYFDKSEDNNIQEGLSIDVENNFYKEVYDGNDKICGYWVNGLLEGEAQIEYHNGDYFKGKFEKGYKVEGLMVFKDQGSYQGTFYNQQFHGRGVLRLKDKTISAEWANGLVEGSCVVEYKNGNVYYGPLKDFKKHGYGYLYFPNDSKFFGQFVDGMLKGYGEYFEKGKLKSKGLWKNGKLMQEKKEEDWSYNFEDENFNWNQTGDTFEKTGSSFAMCLEMVFNHTAKMEEEERFKEMLKSLKQTKQAERLSRQMPFSQQECNSESEVEKMSMESSEPQISEEEQKGMFGFLKF